MMDTYNYYIYDQMDPHFKGKFLMESPVPITILVLSYVLFVKLIGPWWMKNRPPYNVDKAMLLYNIVQMSVNTHFTYMAITTVLLSGKYNIVCVKLKSEPDPSDDVIVWTTYCFFVSRVLDFLDTVFMVLKKNNHQVSFLHVYHHLMVVTVGWVVIKYTAGGSVIFFGLVNSLVHAVMYTYYFLTAYNPVYKKSIWWKQKITQLQLVQFVMVVFQLVIAIFSKSCGYPTSLLLIIISQVLAMLYLFSRFYKMAYVQKHS